MFDAASEATAIFVARDEASVPATGLAPRFDIFRLVDVVVATAALIAFAPLMLLIALIIRLQDGGPAFFGHQRMGFGGHTFRCWKFRSMVVDADKRLATLLSSSSEARREWTENQKLRDDPRVTKLGDFLRKSSLDELPQLLNVIVGEMSLVGPRPIVASEISRYGRFYRHYCAARPGITGLWQIGGRSDVSYRRRVAYDRLYIRSAQPRYNLIILTATVPAVLARRGSC